MNAVIVWLVVNKPLLMALIVWPFITAVLNYLSTRKTPEEWEAWAMRHKLSALGLTVLRGSGVDVKKIVNAFRSYAARKAGKVPEGAVAQAQLPPALKAALSNPEFLASLESYAATLNRVDRL